MAGNLITHGRDLIADALHHVVEFAHRIDGPGAKARDVAPGDIGKRLAKANAVVFRMEGNMPLRLVTNGTLGHIDNAAQAHRIVRVIQDAQVGHHIADFTPLIKARATHHLVRNSGADKDIFQRTGGVIGAVHDRDIGIAAALIRQGVDFRGDEPRLIVLIIGNIAYDLLALTVGGPQVLLAAVLIFCNNGIGRVENGLCGAIVLLQQDGVRLRVVALEFLNIADGGPAEGINGLIGIAHYAQLRRIRTELSPTHERSN